MDYIKHYNLLIERAKTRQLTEYSEKHHIIPRCMNGTNDSSNIVNLTPEEHFVAHQLLIKIYPTEINLIYAATMMGVKSTNQERNNKVYGWLRRKHSSTMKLSQAGKNNSQYGTCYVSHINDQQCKRINKNELTLYLNAGWIKKRIIKWNSICSVCNKKFPKIGFTKFCSEKCKSIHFDNIRNGQNSPNRKGFWITPKGSFSTCYEAAEANNTCHSTILNRVKSNNFPAFYISPITKD